MNTAGMIVRAILDSIRPRDLAPNERIDVIGVAPDMMSDDADLTFVIRYYRLDGSGRKKGLHSKKCSLHEHFVRRALRDKGVLVHMIVTEMRQAIDIVRPATPA